MYRLGVFFVSANANRFNQALRNNVLSAEIFETWVAHYNLRQRLRYSPPLDITSPEVSLLHSVRSSRLTLRNELQETRHLFRAYVGAVVAQSGPAIATNWVTQLIDPKAEILSSPDEEEATERRATKRPRAQPPSPATTPPPLPTQPPPAAIPMRSNDVPNSLNHTAAQPIPAMPLVIPSIGPQAVPNRTSSQKGPGYLLIFNQQCAQQHHKVDYPAENRGSPHAPIWIIKCLGT